MSKQETAYEVELPGRVKFPTKCSRCGAGPFEPGTWTFAHVEGPRDRCTGLGTSKQCRAYAKDPARFQKMVEADEEEEEQTDDPNRNAHMKAFSPGVYVVAPTTTTAPEPTTKEEAPMPAEGVEDEDQEPKEEPKEQEEQEQEEQVDNKGNSNEAAPAAIYEQARRAAARIQVVEQAVRDQLTREVDGQTVPPADAKAGMYTKLVLDALDYNNPTLDG